MPDSVELLPDSVKDSSRVAASIHVVGDILDNMTELVTAAKPAPEVILKSRKKIYCFGKLRQSLDYASLSQ